MEAIIKELTGKKEEEEEVGLGRTAQMAEGTEQLEEGWMGRRRKRES